jgi:hypothetical protein
MSAVNIQRVGMSVDRKVRDINLDTDYKLAYWAVKSVREIFDKNVTHYATRWEQGMVNTLAWEERAALERSCRHVRDLVAKSPLFIVLPDKMCYASNDDATKIVLPITISATNVNIRGISSDQISAISTRMIHSQITVVAIAKCAWDGMARWLDGSDGCCCTVL